MPLITHIEHMCEKPHAEYALSLLQKVARRVEPIMIRRGYMVGTLCEFFHSDRSLGASPCKCGEDPPNPTQEWTKREGNESLFVSVHHWTIRYSWISKRLWGQYLAHFVVLYCIRTLALNRLCSTRLTHNIYGSHNKKFDALLEEHMVEYAILTVANQQKKDERLERSKVRGRSIPDDQGQDGGLATEVKDLGKSLRERGGGGSKNSKTFDLIPPSRPRK